MAIAIVDTGITVASSGSVSSLTKSAVTLTAGVNLLLVGVVIRSTDTVSGVTFNGVSLTSLGTAEGAWYSQRRKSSLWYLVDPPTGAAYDIVATFSASLNDAAIGAASFSGYGSFGSVYTANNPVDEKSAGYAVTVADRSAGDYAIGMISSDPTVTEGQTLIASQISSSNQINMEYSTSSGSLTWSGPTEAVWSTIGVAIKPAAETGHPASRRMGGVQFAGNQSLGMNRW